MNDRQIRLSSWCLFMLICAFFSCKQLPDKQPLAAHSSPTTHDLEQAEQPLLKLAIGSCNKQNEEQPLWDDVLNQKPNAWVWLGDNIYGDTEDMNVMKEKYNIQYNHPTYTEVRESMDIYGIWDDHDYGVNDGGEEYSKKAESRDLLFEFIELPKTDKAWKHEGAYQSHIIKSDGVLVKLILIDSRYFREKPSRKLNVYSKEYGPDILGEDQWEWLEKELQDENADYIIIGNGIQIIPEDHKYEKWANLPSSRDRLFNLIKRKTNQRVILLSGDRHLSEVSAIQLDSLSYPLYDITSSGLTHTYRSFQGETNQHRIGDVITEKSFGLFKFYKNEDDDIKVLYQIWGDNNKKLQELVLF